MANPSSHVRFINPPTLASPPGYTQVVDVKGGRTVYIAGQVALNQSREIIGRGDFQAQARQVFENLKLALGAVGADFSQVVKINIYLLDMGQLPVLAQVRDQYVNKEHPPASTAVQVVRLAREEFMLEVEAVASLPE